MIDFKWEEKGNFLSQELLMILPSVGEFKTVLVTGIHTVDSGYQALNSMQFAT